MWCCTICTPGLRLLCSPRTSDKASRLFRLDPEPSFFASDWLAALHITKLYTLCVSSSDLMLHQNIYLLFVLQDISTVAFRATAYVATLHCITLHYIVVVEAHYYI